MFFIRIKSTKSTKVTKVFFFLDVFIRIKILFFVHIKAIKTHISEKVTLYFLRLFCFCSLMCALCFFLCVKSSVKKIKRFEIALMTLFILLLKNISLSLSKCLKISIQKKCFNYLCHEYNKKHG